MSTVCPKTLHCIIRTVWITIVYMYVLTYFKWPNTIFHDDSKDLNRKNNRWMVHFQMSNGVVVSPQKHVEKCWCCSWDDCMSTQMWCYPSRLTILMQIIQSLKFFVIFIYVKKARNIWASTKLNRPACQSSFQIMCCHSKYLLPAISHNMRGGGGGMGSNLKRNVPRHPNHLLSWVWLFHAFH